MELARDGRCNWGEALKRSQSAATYQSAHEFMTALAKDAKKWFAMGGGPLVFGVKPLTRTEQENRLLHSLIGQIAKQKEWAGQKRTTEVWKRLLVSAWSRATGQGVEILPALDGFGVDLVPVRTSKLTVRECAELIEFIQCWSAVEGIVFEAIEEQR